MGQQMEESESFLENEWINASAANFRILRRDECCNLDTSKYCIVLSSLIS